MLARILVPLDGSALAECVLPHVVALAAAFDAQVTLMRSVEHSSIGTSKLVVDPYEWQFRLAEADAYLGEVAERLRALDIDAEKTTVEGPAAERVVELARDLACDLVVLSSHGRSGLTRWNVSSVVQKVVLRVQTPVMIVRAHQPGPVDLREVRYRRMMVPLDGSQRAEYALPLAIALARRHESDLLLAHVASAPEVPHQLPLSQEERGLIQQLAECIRQRGEDYLATLRERLDYDVETRLLTESQVATALHKLADREQVDLILLTAHGHSGESTWPYGKTTFNLITYGTTPLLIFQDLAPEDIARTQVEETARLQSVR